MDIKTKHCKTEISPTLTYCLDSMDSRYQWQYLHTFHCPDPHCAWPELMAWHGVRQNGTASQLFDIARKDYDVWKKRIAEVHEFMNRRFKMFVSQATGEISRDPARGLNALRVLRRFRAKVS